MWVTCKGMHYLWNFCSNNKCASSYKSYFFIWVSQKSLKNPAAGLSVRGQLPFSWQPQLEGTEVMESLDSSRPCEHMPGLVTQLLWLCASPGFSHTHSSTQSWGHFCQVTHPRTHFGIWLALHYITELGEELTSLLRWTCQPKCAGPVCIYSSCFLYPFVLFMLFFYKCFSFFTFLLMPMYLAYFASLMNICIYFFCLDTVFFFSNILTSLAHWTCRRLPCIPASAHAVPLCRKPFPALPEECLHAQAELSLGRTAAITL